MDHQLSHDESDEQFWDEGDRSKLVFDEHLLDRPIQSIPLRPAVIVPAGTMVADAIRQMRERKIGSTMVTRDGRLVGIITERDVMMKVVLGELPIQTTKVEDLMRPSPDVLTPDYPLAYAINLMSHGGFRHVPLVDAQLRPVGMISVRDIVDYFAEFFKEKILNLPPTPQSAIAPHREGG
jgi:CBS domain-containing protein